jgi:hypothetical protein
MPKKHIEKKPLISLHELPDSRLKTYNLTLTNHFKGHFFARPVLLQQSQIVVAKKATENSSDIMDKHFNYSMHIVTSTD